MPKKAYRVCNWGDYNRSLVSRGSLTFWISPEVVESWESQKGEGHGNQKYSDLVITCGLTLQQLFRLPLRATQGMMRSLAEMRGLSVDTPDYSTLSRRGKGLRVDLGVKASAHARHVLVDSTGIQVFGEGEWKTLRHGERRYQLWRKLHIAMDAGSHDILATTMTEYTKWDGICLAGLIDQIEGAVCQITGDGAYDKKACYQAAYVRDQAQYLRQV